MKSYIPRSLSSRKWNAHGTTAALMRHCLLWQWLHEVLAPGYSLRDQLAKLCKKNTHSNKVGLWRLAWWWKKAVGLSNHYFEKSWRRRTSTGTVTRFYSFPTIQRQWGKKHCFWFFRRQKALHLQRSLPLCEKTQCSPWFRSTAATQKLCFYFGSFSKNTSIYNDIV